MSMKRREFLGGVAAASALPLFNIGCAGFGTARARQIAAGTPIRIALIGCGGRMGMMRPGGMPYGIMHTPCRLGETIAAIVDPDPRLWEKTRQIVKHWQPQTDVAKIPCFYDYREMFAKIGDALDAVMIATPNHHHALAAVLAMRLGLHVYVEKPMALTVNEVAVMHRVSRETGVVTQVGNHGHSEEGMRRLVEYIRAGAIGQVREVWSFDDRLNAMLQRPASAPPPAGMDWDAWCGPAPICDYYPATRDHMGMHPHDWHDWIGYGNGSIGNMGTHIIDPVFWALDLGSVNPVSVEAKRAEWGCPGSWTWSTELEWRYPARAGMDAVTLHWFDGVKPGIPYDREHVNNIGCCNKREYQHLPPIVTELEKKYGQSLGALGSIFVGEKGIIRVGAHGEGLVFGPKELYKQRPPKLFAREKGMDHQVDWLRAIRNPERPCGCNFDYSAPLARTVLLGNAAPRAGKRRLLWNGASFTNAPEADRYLATTYRPDWQLENA